jgi:hypothetical protein
MPVKVQCTNCKATLELDDGFRGGVCRCRECKSLLQVPRSANEGTAKARPQGPGAIPAPIGPAPTVSSSPDSPLSPPNLSDPRSAAMAASGGSGLRHPRPSPTAHAPAKKRSHPASSSEKSYPPSLPTTASTLAKSHTQEIKKNNFMLGVAITLGALIAVTVIVIVIMYLLH